MIEPFGKLADGRTVHAVTLGSVNELQAQVLTYGGILRSLTFSSRGTRYPLIVTLPDLDAYVRDTGFVGIIAGRVANRIEGARFTLHDREHRLVANDGANQLHGGPLGFGKKLWRVLDQQGPNRLRLVLHSPAGDEGYPGNIDVTVEYVVVGSELRVRFECRADEDTPFSPTYHPYFQVTDDHRLRIPAASFLPVRDSQMVPTGEISSVVGTPFDFRSPRLLRSPPIASHPQLEFAGGYDHCWVLDPARDCDAELHSAASEVTLTIQSDRPGIQFYGGQHSAALRAICLEPEGLPNALNVPAFPSIIVKARQRFVTTFRYRVSLRR